VSDRKGTKNHLQRVTKTRVAKDLYFIPANFLVDLRDRGDHFRFGSVFIKKSNQIEIKKKTETEPKPGQTDRFRFGFLGPKPFQTGLARFFPVMLGFFGLARFVFGFFGFRLIKPKPNRIGRFF
jgi:hypothetical protein